jgi:hypothetical protein
MRNEITNSDDLIDSRDVMARVVELEEEREALTTALADASKDAIDHAKDALNAWEEEEGRELAALNALAADAEGYSSDWSYGAVLIRDSYFEDYAQELAEDIGAINRNAVWPNNCIDWTQAARELQQDYTAVDFDGVTYWVR